MLNKNSKLSEFPFSERSKNALDIFLCTSGESCESITAYQLSQYDKDDLLRSRNLGSKTFNEIDSILKSVGLDINDYNNLDKVIDPFDPCEAYINEIKELLRTPLK
jgi:DNA-directed RNA polymerase alpha subunit